MSQGKNDKEEYESDMVRFKEYMKKLKSRGVEVYGSEEKFANATQRKTLKQVIEDVYNKHSDAAPSDKKEWAPASTPTKTSVASNEKKDDEPKKTARQRATAAIDAL